MVIPRSSGTEPGLQATWPLGQEHNENYFSLHCAYGGASRFFSSTFVKNSRVSPEIVGFDLGKRLGIFSIKIDVPAFPVLSHSIPSRGGMSLRRRREERRNWRGQ